MACEEPWRIFSVARRQKSKDAWDVTDAAINFAAGYHHVKGLRWNFYAPLARVLFPPAKKKEGWILFQFKMHHAFPEEY